MESLVFLEIQVPQKHHVRPSPRSDLEISAAEKPRKNAQTMGNGNGKNTVVTASFRAEGSCADDCVCQEARKDVETFTQRLVRLHDSCFTELSIEDAQTCSGRTMDVSGNVQLVLMDPLFNISRVKLFWNQNTTQLMLIRYMTSRMQSASCCCLEATFLSCAPQSKSRREYCAF